MSLLSSAYLLSALLLNTTPAPSDSVAAEQPQLTVTPSATVVPAPTPTVTSAKAKAKSFDPAVDLAISKEEGWEEKANTNGVLVYARDKQGSTIKALRAVGTIDAPPHVVMRILADYERYTETMPYTEKSQVLARESDGAVIFYTVIDPPIVSRRDYALRITDESDWRGGRGYLRTRWTLSDKGPPPQDGHVRVPLNDGSWTLQPRHGGTKTYAIYDLFTDPGGSLTTFIINKANRSTIPDLFEVLRKHSKDPRYKEASSEEKPKK
ncbi:MAG: hypothetical protein LBM75_09600 [Myxococcales bacterium]|jgi:hypothetical protein|nr:hypothetical protein [Myxococcales bacterium]